VQLILLYATIALVSTWIFKKQKKVIPFALGCLLLFAGVRSYSFYQAKNQQRLIVYNIPKTQAVDLVQGRKFLRFGDSALLSERTTYQFYLHPSETMFRMKNATDLQALIREGPLFNLGGRNLLLLDASIQIPNKSVSVSAIVLSKDVRIDLLSILSQVRPSMVIADASNHSNKVRSWKRTCDSLAIKFHNVSTDGAFQMQFR
jgi:competence protein ComEC